MKIVGIIANPASGRDIRRLVAGGTTVSNREKQNIIMRMLMAMDALGVERVEMMPDSTHIGERVISEIANELNTTQVSMLDMPHVLGTQQDSVRAAELMAERAFGCIIVLGGDGTCRVVAKGCDQVPLLPISTGTNNAFPQVTEGTLVGMAAAAIVSGKVTADEVCERMPQLELFNERQELVDIALVDIAVVDATGIAARAVWEPQTIKEIYLTQAKATSIGLSAIGGQLSSVASNSGVGMKVSLGDGGTSILAPIAPGLVSELSVRYWQLFSEKQLQTITYAPAVIALDGERELLIGAGEHFCVHFNSDGPWVVNIERALTNVVQRDHLERRPTYQSVAAAGRSFHMIKTG